MWREKGYWTEVRGDFERLFAQYATHEAGSCNLYLKPTTNIQNLSKLHDTSVLLTLLLLKYKEVLKNTEYKRFGSFTAPKLKSFINYYGSKIRFSAANCQ